MHSRSHPDSKHWIDLAGDATDFTGIWLVRLRAFAAVPPQATIVTGRTPYRCQNYSTYPNPQQDRNMS